MTSGAERPDDPTVLTTQQRASARRLGRMPAHGTVARASASRAPWRWPLALGIAAALALGIAWQLHPLPGGGRADQAQSTAAAPLTRPTTTAIVAAPESGAMPAPAAMASDVPPPTLPPAGTAVVPPALENGVASLALDTALVTAPARTLPAAPAPAPTPPPPVADLVFNAASAMTPPSLPAAAGVSAARAFDTTPMSPAAAAPAAPQTDGSRSAAPSTLEPALPETSVLDRLQASGAPPGAETGAQTTDQPASDVAPATLASPPVRDAWLARIRELAAAGQTQAVRDSLHAFQHRYPEYILPDDLRALGQ